MRLPTLKNQTHHNQGLTLIELLISISVMTIIIGITIAGYSSFNQRQKLLSYGQTVSNILRDAQSRAYNSEIDCSICNCSTSATRVLQGWEVDLKNHQFYGKCNGQTFPQPPPVIPTGFIITPIPNDKILFRSYPLGVDNQSTICLSSSDLADNYYLIYINNVGDISDSGGFKTLCLTPTPYQGS